jgi:hypothetical protein
MHQTKVACIARHGRGSAWHQRLMRHICRRAVAAGLLDHHAPLKN